MFGTQGLGRLIPLAAAMGWATLIFYLSSLHHVAVSDDPWWDLLTRKAAHVFVFAVLSFLVAATVHAFRLPQPMLIGAAVAVLYAATDELHQGFVAERSPMATDVVVDALGVALGVGLWWLFAARGRDAPTR